MTTRQWDALQSTHNVAERLATEFDGIVPHANPCFPTIRNAPTSANADQKARVCPLTAEVGTPRGEDSERHRLVPVLGSTG